MVQTLKQKWEGCGEARAWFRLALIFGGMFLVGTIIYATEGLDMATLVAERWLVGRPLTSLDCVLLEWRNIGAAPLVLGLVALIGIIGALTRRYRWRVALYLVLLILFGAVVEGIGKKLITLPIPSSLQSGMTTLTCPQRGDSLSLRLQLSLGMWWKAPVIPINVQDWAQTVSQLPLTISTGKIKYGHTYPSGHAARWWFLGLVLAWLCWRHNKRAVVRWFLTSLVLLLCFLGASIQFYTGVHFLSDTIAGYVLGTALACAAIGVLLLNDTHRDHAHHHHTSSGSPQRRADSLSYASRSSLDRFVPPLVEKRPPRETAP